MKEGIRIGVACVAVLTGAAHGGAIEQLRPSEKWAAGYAHQAVEQFKESEEFKCGFKEDRWHHDFYSHQAWALRSGKESARAENLIRADFLKKCKDARRYVALTSKDVKENIFRECDYSGPEWTPLDAAHFEWAMLNDEVALEKRLRERQEALKKCRK